MKKVLLLLTLAVAGCTAAFAEMAGGTLATGVTWSVSDDGHILSFEGTGGIPSYGYDYVTQESSTPWHRYRNHITDVKLGNQIDFIGKFCFTSLCNLTNIEVDPDNEDLSSIDGVLFSDNVILSVCPPGKSGAYMLPPNVEEIEEEAFAACKELTEINVNEGCKVIYEDAFRSSGITSIIMPISTTRIYSGAFQDCLQLKEVTFSSNLDFIGPGAFGGCHNLENFYATGSGNVTVLDGFLVNLEDMTLLLMPTGMKGEVSIPEGIKGINTHALFDCQGMTAIHLPKSFNGSLTNADFFTCNNVLQITVAPDNDFFIVIKGILYRKTDMILDAVPKQISQETLVLQDGMTSYLPYSIPDLPNVDNIVFPESLNGFSNFCFGKSLKGFFLKKKVPIAMIEGIDYYYDIEGEIVFHPFMNLDLDNCTLYVPIGSRESFAMTIPYNLFKHIEEYDFTQSGMNETDLKSDKPADVYNLLGVKVLSNVLPSEANSLLPSGIYIIGNKKMLVK